jgi:hypothetical protein
MGDVTRQQPSAHPFDAFPCRGGYHPPITICPKMIRPSPVSSDEEVDTWGVSSVANDIGMLRQSECLLPVLKKLLR